MSSLLHPLPRLMSLLPGIYMHAGAVEAATGGTLDMERALCALSSCVSGRSASKRALKKPSLLSPVSLIPQTKPACERQQGKVKAS